MQPMVDEFRGELSLSTSDPTVVAAICSWHKVVDPACVFAGHDLPKGSEVIQCARLEPGAGGNFGSLSPPDQWLPTRARTRDGRAPPQPHQLHIGKGLLGHCGPTAGRHGDILVNLFEEIVPCRAPADRNGDILVKLFEEIVPCRAQPAAFHLVIGLPRSVEDFCKESRAKIHPCDRDPPGVDASCMTVLATLTKGPKEAEARRKARRVNLRGLAKEPEKAEAFLRKLLVPGVHRVLGDMKLLLLDRVREQIGHEYASVVKDMASGFPLLGSPPPCGLFELKGRPQQPPEERKALVKGTREQADPAKGWLEGPFSPEELSRRFGPLWTGALRPESYRGEKVRWVDDFSESRVNAATGTSGKLRLGGIDEVVATAVPGHRTLSRARSTDAVQVVPRTGVVMHAPLDLHGHQPGSWQLVGKTWDLQDAYQLLALLPAQRVAAVVATPQESGAPQPRASGALPVGTISSVHFAKFFEALGVTIGLSFDPAPQVVIVNRPGRVKDVGQAAADARMTGILPPAAAALLRGRRLYSERRGGGGFGTADTRPLERRALHRGGRLEGHARGGDGAQVGGGGVALPPAAGGDPRGSAPLRAALLRRCGRAGGGHVGRRARRAGPSH